MKKFRDIFFNSFLYCLAIELVEELLEELIAFELTIFIAWVATKAISVVTVVFFTQSTKLVIKKIIKHYTYKEGNDKMKKIKKFFTWLNANKCTLGGIATGALTVVSGLGVIDVNAFAELNVGGFNLTPVLYYVVLGALTIVCSFFPETIEKFAQRVGAKKAEKQAKAITKEAKAELKAEAKKANQTQAEAEKAQAKADAEAKAKAEKEKAEAEHRAKVEAEKAKLKAIANETNQNA